MRVLKWGGQEVRFNERDYKQLLERFDPGIAKRERIRVQCICEHYGLCKGCPFTLEAGRTVCCIAWIRSILGPVYKITLFRNVIAWSCTDTAAQREIQMIRDELLKAEKR